MKNIRIMVAGAAGRMGREVLDAVRQAEDLELVAAVDNVAGGQPVVTASGVVVENMTISADLAEAIGSSKPDVMVDFTIPEVVRDNIVTALEAGVRPVVGTTGLDAADLTEIRELAGKRRLGALVAPNFAIGAVLMMKYAVEIARHMNRAEIIEFHHDLKLDAPSGTALKTAEMITENMKLHSSPTKVMMVEGVRGGEVGGVNIHSVRLPGYVASQEVIFGALAQTLTIRHDTVNRQAFMPGVVLGCRRIMDLEGLVYGLENLL